MGLPSACNLIFFCVFYDSVREHGQSHHAYPGTAVCDGLFCRCAVKQLQQQPVQQQQQLQQQSELQQPVWKQQLQQQLEHEQQKHEQQQLQQHEQQQQQLEQQPELEHEQQQQLGRPAILRLQQIQLFQHPVVERLRGQPPLRMRQRAVHDLLQGHQEPPQEEGQDVPGRMWRS